MDPRSPEDRFRNPLSPEQLRRRPAGTIGALLVLRVEADSTNDEAFRRIEAGEGPHGLVILAERQTRGRGRGENRW